LIEMFAAKGLSVVIAGLDPAIHRFRKTTDAPVNPRHDDRDAGN
jgi:hypothetical protein